MIELIKTVVLAIIGLALLAVGALGLSTPSDPPKPTPVEIEPTPTVSTSTQSTATEPAGLQEVKPEEPKKPVVIKPKPPAPPQVDPAPIAEVIETITAPASATTSALSLNDRVRGSVVNIICTASAPLNAISASGVVIDPKGIILTNAHVAQYFLLKNYPAPNSVDCVIRTGSPAQSKYTAELAFLPPSWIQKNAHKIKDENPTGNGEHDYALVRITGTVNPQASLPASLPYLPVGAVNIVQGQSTLTAGYPAGFLGGITIAQDLHQASSNTLIRELYTFGTVTVDIFSIGGSVVAQQGSSGGAVANQDGELIGLIVTATDGPDTASRDLRALASAYIIRDFENESGRTLESYVGGDIVLLARQFQLGIAPTLTQTLVNELTR